jgi:alpha-ketoglutarate-dependent 2,4-dichlorophenoxyacetate dioxygenase
MPHKTNPEYQFIATQKLTPTFGAEISGIDFSKPVSSDVFAEVKDAIGKVVKHTYTTTTTTQSLHLSALIPSRQKTDASHK